MSRVNQSERQRGPRRTPEEKNLTRDLIGEEYSKDAGGRDSQTTLARKVISQLVTEGFPKREESGIEKDIRAMVKAGLIKWPKVPRRPQASAEAVEEPTELDPWEPRWNAKFGIPDEAMPALLSVWHWTRVTGMLFSFRQAQWVSRLRGCLPSYENTPGGLWAWASRFAFRGPAVDVSDLLADLSGMTTWERQTAETVGRISPLPSGGMGPSVLLLGRMSVGNSAITALNIGPGNDPLWFINEPLMLSAEAEQVYSLWVRHLGQGPRWNALSDQEHQHIVLELRDWVEAEEARRRQWKRDLELKPFTVSPPLEKPTNLLREVGYLT